jgi:hypothetical protein
MWNVPALEECVYILEVLYSYMLVCTSVGFDNDVTCNLNNSPVLSAMDLKVRP